MLEGSSAIQDILKDFGFQDNMARSRLETMWRKRRGIILSIYAWCFLLFWGAPPPTSVGMCLFTRLIRGGGGGVGFDWNTTILSILQGRPECFSTILCFWFVSITPRTIISPPPPPPQLNSTQLIARDHGLGRSLFPSSTRLILHNRQLAARDTMMAFKGRNTAVLVSAWAT